MSPKLSVVIPVYKVEPYLRQCLDSIVNQTYRELEIILVDDGSPDNCGMICDEYAASDPRVVVIHKQNGGLSAARNDGLDAATGEWITFVDSDDWCDVDYFEQMFSGMGDKAVDVFSAGGRWIEDEKGSFVRMTYTEDFFYKSRDEINSLVVRVVMPMNKFTNLTGVDVPWDKLYRVAFLRSNGLRFDVTNRAWEDLWFNLRVMDKATAVGGCICIGYHYRMVPTSITKGYNPDKPVINYGFIQDVYRYLEGREISPQMQQALDIRCFRMILNACQCHYFHPNNPHSTRETVKELEQMKTWPYYHDAIWRKDNSGLTKRQIVLKYDLRLRGGGRILRFLYKARQITSR